MFKPMQYYHKSFYDNDREIICEMDTVNKTIENLLKYCVYASFVFIFGTWIIGIIDCLVWRKSKESKRKVGSSGIMPRKIKMVYSRFEKAMIILAVILGVFFYLTLIYASGVMISKRVQEHRSKKDAWKIVMISKRVQEHRSKKDAW
eukprot:144591_1